MEYHDEPVLDRRTLPGLVIGYVVLAVFLTIAISTIIYDQLRLHRLLMKNLHDDRTKMTELGMNIEDVDRQYQEKYEPKKVKKNVAHAEEQQEEKWASIDISTQHEPNINIYLEFS